MICLAGKNDIAVNALKYLIYELKLPKEDLFVVPNDTDTGVDSWQKSLRKVAREENIVICSLEECLNTDVFISLEYNKIIDPSKFKSKRIYNIHFSKLPAYKGMYTSVMPLLYGEKESGVTLHYIDDGIDTGAIIDQLTFPIEITDTARSLYFKYLSYGYKLFEANIMKLLLQKNPPCRPQECIGASYFSKKSIDYKNIFIDLRKTSFEIYNQVRAFIFEEYQFPEILGKKVCEINLCAEKTQANLIIQEENYIYLSGIDGYLMKAKILPKI